MKYLQKYPLIKQIFLMVLVFFVLIVIVFSLLKLFTKHGKEYVLPDLLNRNIEEVLQDRELDKYTLVVIDSIFVNGKEGGVILAMDPIPQSLIKSGRKIYLTITSYSPEEVEMPDLVDLTLRQAISQLESYDLKCGTLSFANDIAQNAVLKQMYNGKIIAHKEKLPRFSLVDLVIGSGAENATTFLPLLIGKSPDEARKALQMSSLNVGIEHFSEDDDREKLKVIKQFPEFLGRRSLPLGMQVDIWYAPGDKADFDKIIKQYNEMEVSTDSINQQAQEAQGATNDW